jgi:hypothetical protein
MIITPLPAAASNSIAAAVLMQIVALYIAANIGYRRRYVIFFSHARVLLRWSIYLPRSLLAGWEI